LPPAGVVTETLVFSRKPVVVPAKRKEGNSSNFEWGLYESNFDDNRRRKKQGKKQNLLGQAATA
jgi:hypothetical protein